MIDAVGLFLCKKLARVIRVIPSIHLIGFSVRFNVQVYAYWFIRLVCRCPAGKGILLARVQLGCVRH